MYPKNWVARCNMFRDAVRPRVVDVLNTFEISISKEEMATISYPNMKCLLGGMLSCGMW